MSRKSVSLADAEGNEQEHKEANFGQGKQRL